MHRHMPGCHLSEVQLSGGPFVWVGTDAKVDICPGKHLSGKTFVQLDICLGIYLSE